MKIANRARLERRLKSMPVHVRQAVKEQLKANADELVETQKRFAGQFENSTGALVSTIRTEDASTSHSITQRVSAGGPEAPIYAAWVEFGTSRSAAKPFFWPAYRMLKRRFKTRMNRAVRRAIREGSN